MDEFPSIECCNECQDDTLECSNCKNWVHRTCVPMTKSDFRTWSVNSRIFLCRKCCFRSDKYDAIAGLDRLSSALATGRAIDLINVASSEQGLLDIYGVNVDNDFSGCRVGAVDSVSQRIVEMYQPIFLQQYVPLSIIGDGNCFYRAVSRSLYGHENLHVLLRLKTAIEVILNRKYYDTGRRSYVDLIQDNRIVVSDYKKLLTDTLTLGSYSEMLHMYALSAALNMPLRSYYPPQIQPELASDAFSRKVIGRKVSAGKTVKVNVMWTQMIVPTNIRIFMPNHFVALREIGSEPIQQIIIDDASTSAQKSKPVSGSKVTKSKKKQAKQIKTRIISETTEVNIPIKDDKKSSKSDKGVHNSEILTGYNQTTSSDNSSKLLVSYNVTEEETIFGTDITFDHGKIADRLDTSDKDNTSDSGKNTDSLDTSNKDNTSDSHDSGKNVDSLVMSDFDDTSDSDIHQQNDTEVIENDSTDDDRATGSLSDGKFLETNQAVSILLKSETALDHIPGGLKENTFFIINNKTNMENKTNKKKCSFSDDCGAWNSSAGTSPRAHFMITEGGNLKKIYLKKGVFCWEKQVNKKREYIPIEPQPSENEIAVVHRYYTTLQLDANYKRRVTYLGNGGVESDFALVEYLGKFSGLAPHGNSKSADSEYLRTPDFVMTEMADLLQSNKPNAVYHTLTRKYDEVTRPSSVAQVRDKKKYENAKGRGNVHTKNIADHIQILENMVTENHTFVRSIIRDKNKTPTIILYNDEQLMDLKNICCGGHSVLGVDKTFNLCDMHVTVTCYKQMTVKRTRTEEPPIFLGPIFIHDNSDFESYGQFFYHLKMKLVDMDLANLVIGSDDERAMVKAIVSAFPDSTHVLCSRHLKQNAIQKLTDDAIDRKDRYAIIHRIFGEDGIAEADDTICFEEKSASFETYCADKSEQFLQYFKNRLKTQLRLKVNEPARNEKVVGQWTNNNSESINHVLKQAIEQPRQFLMIS